MRKLTLLVVLLAACSVVSARTAPDFSGRWTSEPEAPAAPGGGRGGAAQPADIGSGWGSTITLSQTATALTVEYAFFARGDMQPPMKFVYALDGSESKNTVMMGRGMQVQTSRTAWNGDALIITTSHLFTNPETGKPATAEVKRTLTLASPTSLVVETTVAGVLGGVPVTSKTTYRKLT